MIRSMTGFGRSQAECNGFAMCAEARAVNNKGLRVNFRLPDHLQGLDPELERIVRQRIARGTVNVQISMDDLSGDPGYVVDEAAATYYGDCLRGLGEKIGVTDKIRLDMLVGLPGVLRRRSSADKMSEELVAAVKEMLGSALDELVGVREYEGKNIWQDILSHGERIAGLVTKVEAEIPKVLAQYRERMMERLRPVLDDIGAAISEDDVRKEVVFFADRSDISEEVARLRSHIELMKTMDAKDEPCGRQVEFVAQEMFREANTMASKANDPAVVPTVLDIKSEVEKIREQALNLE